MVCLLECTRRIAQADIDVQVDTIPYVVLVVRHCELLHGQYILLCQCLPCACRVMQMPRSSLCWRAARAMFGSTIASGQPSRRCMPMALEGEWGAGAEVLGVQRCLRCRRYGRACRCGKGSLYFTAGHEEGGEVSHQRKYVQGVSCMGMCGLAIRAG